MRVRTGHLVSAALAILLLAAGGAQASCETRAFIKLGPGPYTPGSAVTVTGERFEPGTTVRTRVGTTAATSVLVAETTTDVEGTWTVSFQVPAETSARGYAVMADAMHSDGTLTTAIAEMPVEAQAPATPAPQIAPGAEPREQRAGGRPNRGAHRDSRGSGDGQPTSTQSPSSPPVTARLPASTPSSLSSRAFDDLRGANEPVTKPRAAAPATPAPDAVPAPAPDTATAPEPAPESASADEAAEEFPIPVWVTVIAAVLLWGTVGWVAVARRRRPPLEPQRVDWQPPTGPPLPPPAVMPDAMEAALQELIAEEHAREDERERALAGTP